MEKNFLLNEGNVISVYKKLINNEHVPEEEQELVKKRFYEILNGKDA